MGDDSDKSLAGQGQAKVRFCVTGLCCSVSLRSLCVVVLRDSSQRVAKFSKRSPLLDCQLCQKNNVENVSVMDQ